MLCFAILLVLWKSLLSPIIPSMSLVFCGAPQSRKGLMLLRTHPGGFTAPTPEDFHHPHSLPDEPSGWGDVIQLPATLTKVLLSLEKRLKRALRRRAAAKNMTVVDTATANGEISLNCVLFFKSPKLGHLNCLFSMSLARYQIPFLG